MDLESAERILENVQRSSVQDAIRRQWLEAAVRYAELRVAWWMAPAIERRDIDGSRTAAHDAFIDACNILSRAMAAAGEPNTWRAEIGTGRGEIGDFACILHCVLGLKAQ